MNIEPVEFTLKTQLAFIDWISIILFFIASIVVGLVFSRRAQKSVNAYFASSQGAPWWILGTSMVATTFAADTPLAISGLVVKQGIWGNWFWWAQIPQFMVGVYFFSRLWRRSGILTDTELVDIRYSGTPSKILRGFRALYYAIPYNALIMGWVNLGMAKILGLTFNVPKLWAVMICVVITCAYSATSGLWGVMATGFFQFFLAMGMTIALAFIGVNAAGGLETLLEKLPQLYGAEQAASMLSVVPSVNAPNYAFTVFLLYFFLLWWTTGTTDGGAYFAQRMISAKNEKHSFLGFLWFNIAHSVLRPWPWIIVGIVAAVMFPGIATRNPLTGRLEADPELGYIAVMLTYLKPGILGLMFAGFLAAFMSTISTQINWGASYLVNDFYRPYIRKDASEKHYVRVSILMVVLSAVMGGAVSFFMTNIFVGWLILSAINAGIGIVLMIRWYWWRINAWSEISAIISILVIVILMLAVKSEPLLKAFLIAMLLLTLAALIIWGLRKKEWRAQYLKSSIFILFVSILAIGLVLSVTLPEKAFPWTLIYSVPISMAVWLTATMLTQPVDEKHLIAFYQRVHPGGPGWKTIAAKITKDYSAGHLFTRKNILGAVFGSIATYCALIGFGQLMLGRMLSAAILLACMAVGIFVVVKNLSQEKWESVK
jgi:Na+/proline symporter